MLQTRIWVGAVLVVLVAGVLALDQAPWYPFLLLLFLFLGVAASRELLLLLDSEQRPPLWLGIGAVLAVLLSNWAPVVAQTVGRQQDPWHAVLGAFAATTLASFLVEMGNFRRPGGSVVRIALGVWIVAYLGLLPCFLIQLRWAPSPGSEPPADRALAAIALTIFTPKVCDIGAYFAGRFLGRHPMAPVLSPKKTWEGCLGGLVLAVVVAVAANRRWPVLGSDASAAGFGLTVGLAGVLGDLAESLIKRDCLRKDSSHLVPGFGGLLDVIDSILFAAPVAYCWFRG